MPYGVNKWASQNSRARSAGKRKGSARRTVKKSSRGSVQRAKKKSGKAKARPTRRTTSRKKKQVRRRAPARRTTKRTTKKKATKKKATKERLYTRYDPETGQKVRVTKDTFEYEEWPSRKPSKKKIQRAALKADPIGVGSQVVTEAIKKSAARTVERETGKLTRKAAGSVAVGSAAATARATVAAVAPAIAAASIVGGALYAMGRIAQLRNVAAGERANRVSREFVATQQAVMKQLRVSKWEDVPSDVRTKLVNGYKKAITEVYSTAVPLAGTIRPSQAIPYGR